MSDELTEMTLQAPARVPAEPRRILLVEDAKDAAVVLSRLVEAWPQVQITRAAEGEDALSSLADDIECVLLDIGMPARFGDGYLEQVRRIRAAEPELPIVVIVENEEQGGAALDAGAQDFVLKRRVDGLAMASAIRHSVQRGRAERFWRELAVLRAQSAETARVQRGLIPHLLIDDARISTRSAYRPGDRRQVLGGDFFDVIQSSPTRLQVVLGDVCGHGPDEAALGVQMRIAWRTLVLAGVGQDRLLVTLDRLAAQERHAEHVYATLASVEIDLDTGYGWVALAGHPPPILACDGAVNLLTEHPGGPPLGLELPPRWARHQVELPPGWTLLLYSDGIYEGRVVSRGTRLGIEGLLDILSSEGPDSVWDAVPDRLLDQVEALNDGPLEDDVALLALRFDR